MTDIIYVFLSKQWAGLAISTCFGMLAILIGAFASGQDPSALKTVMWIVQGTVTILVIALLASASWQALRVRSFMKNNRPQGKLVDIGGFRLHLFAEGVRSDGPVVLWFPGSHDQGMVMQHLHKDIATETRSILFDRAGSGWSDPGPFPRSVASEVDELGRLLSSAGEKGPFLLVGHSFGGLLAVNFAHAFPELVSGLVLLDATSPWNMTTAGKISFGTLSRISIKNAIAVNLGLENWIKQKRFGIESPYQIIGAPLDEIRFLSALPKAICAMGSALWSACRNPFDLADGTGTLGNVPIANVLPASDHQQTREYLRARYDFTDIQLKNICQGSDDASRRLTSLSSQGEVVLAPKNTGHMFPYEDPAFTLNIIHSMIKRLTPTGADAVH